MLATFLVLCAVLGRAIIAPGYMPEQDGATGEITVAMCSAHAGETVRLRLPLNPPGEHRDVHKPCPFAAVAPLFSPAPPALMVAARLMRAPRLRLAAVPHRAANRPSRATPPTGPPQSA